ncbi:Cell wall biosynthesis/cell cycle regulator smi1 [Sphaceloma murrayae]|uniref:Cell wall biosynthesis/cell cycle regulator smi1 n=1 Tax=Sphaceloma murrayae TaxID=2082308 RepID=A0A2K1QL52_9PEZI|nr:Cell wall biosynthesis/cell cycle regulator smi1 [Sphaceloma murrayae]
MTTSLAASWRSFWHAMTSDDRHASPDSPYRSGGHLPLGQNRHSPLTSVTTTAMESRTDLATDQEGFVPSSRPMSPSSPYTPGMRSMQRQSSATDTSYAANGMGNADVPMSNFSDGLPPPPPVSHSWKRIDRWLEDNYEELFENLCEGCTNNDVNELEHELDVTLPQDLRDSLQIHDGQERGGRPAGAIFSCMLLDCEEIVQEYRQWARTNEEYLREGQAAYSSPTLPAKAFAGASTSARAASPTSSTSSNWRTELLSRQDSQPPNAIQKAYVHSGWIPLARDWGGNNICVDLAPGPAGKWGQIILMGRDYDTKYVVARSWGAFLANVADDLATPKPYIDEETHELKLREFPRQNVSPAYMDILRWRADQKYGRRQPARPGGKRPANGALRVNSNVKNEFASLNGFSPYASPVSAATDRGRSPPSQGGQSQSQKGREKPAPSPLSRVTEENTNANRAPDLLAPQPVKGEKVDKLVSIDSPVIGTDEGKAALLGGGAEAESKENQIEEDKRLVNATAAVVGADRMESVQI